MSYSIASVVEGGSLSSITAIASQPPASPNNPITSIRQSLVLYIARVPGSRDVFLTPMKPREKVVTAEDVQSSLYYVHINCEDDQQVLAQLQDRPTSASVDAAQLAPTRENTIKRKPPLPMRRSAPAPLPYPSQDYVPEITNQPRSPRKSQNIARKPVLTDISNSQSPPYPDLDLPIIPSRPLPPTPPDDQFSRRSVHSENVRLLRELDHSDQNNPYERRYSSPVTSTAAMANHEIGSLTLIRRDPGSSEQWNVASVHDPPVQEISSSTLLTPTAARTKKGGAPLYLDIVNPGYNQFIDGDRPDSRISTSTCSSSDSEPPPEGTFRRRLYMPGSRYSDHSYGHQRLKSVDSANGSDMRKTMRDRALSDLNGSNTSVDKRSKSYSFISPWEGRCEFSTGATGKSLKCRHTTSQQGTVEVSELRFNLPSSSRRTPISTAEKRSSYFSHSRSKSQGDEDGFDTPNIMINDDGKVDLTLGQERAGGGFGGKQAKLGKLIIEPEGIKMLDLLVAANIGLWWRAYERA